MVTTSLPVDGAGDKEVGAHGYMPQLDGLRALAVISVVIFHARTAWFPGGYIGVDVFFVLSGYLITRILLSELRKTGRISFRRFYIRRAMRLFPALATVCAVVWIVYGLDAALPERSATLTGALAAVTYVSTWMMAFDISDLGAMVPTWSLAVEEYFYLVWPLLLITFFRSRRYMHRWVLCLIAAAVAYRVVAHFALGWSVHRLYYAPDTRAEQLLIGCGLALVLPGMSRAIPAVWALIAGGLLAAFVLVIPRFTDVWIYHGGGSTVIALLTAVILAHIVTARSGRISTILSLRPLIWIGQRSYGIYLWNVPIIAMFSFIGSKSLIAVGIKLLLSIAVPALSYRFIEQPFLRLKNRFEPSAQPPVRLSDPALD